MITETELIKTWLPEHYICLPRHNGVYCYTKDKRYFMPDDVWFKFKSMLKVKYPTRLVDIVFADHLTTGDIKNKLEFTVVLRS